MKNKMLAIGLLFFFAGCSATNPVESIIRDKQFDQYKITLDELESAYLQKKITYAEYLERKKMTEDNYQKTIDTRRQMIQNQNELKSISEIAP